MIIIFKGPKFGGFVGLEIFPNLHTNLQFYPFLRPSYILLLLNRMQIDLLMILCSYAYATLMATGL